MKRGDIIIVRRIEEKKERNSSVQDSNRPYVIVSNDIANSNPKCKTINVAPLTRNITNNYLPCHFKIRKSKYKSIKYNSAALIEQIRPLDKKDVKYVVCSLDEEDIKKLDRAVYTQLIG